VKAREPFELKVTKELREKLAIWLAQQIDDGQAAKSNQDTEVDYWHQLYEQARTRSTRNLPWPGAADLTSYLGCEKADALHARIMRTIWTDPVCTVSGYGRSADSADFVEEFHQWKAEEERLQSVLDKLALISLIEPRGLLEVYEGSEWITTRKQINARVQTDAETGGLVYDEDGDPIPLRDGSGKILEQNDATQIAATVLVDETDNKRVGPQYRIIPYRDSLILPAHAKDKVEIWAYLKKFRKRHTDIMALATGPRAIYDKESAASLTATGDTESEPALDRSNQTVAPQDETTAEKELWEALLLIDLKMFCEQWSIKVPKGMGSGAPVILRIQHDDVERSRYVVVNLFPRTDRATEGFSFVGNKMITVIEEHTAYRNMAADRSAQANNAPMMRMAGALWDPEEQPWGPGAVIDVRDPRELQQVEVADVPASVFTHMQMTERTGERVAGINDVASGQVSQADRTLGEVEMATEQSFVRMDLVVKRFQEPIEDLYQIRHAIWKRVLAENPTGVEPPDTLMVGLEGRGVPIDTFMPDNMVTGALLEGSYRFKPHGSVETADLGKQRGDFVQSMQFLPNLMAAMQQIALMFGPKAAKMVLRQWVKLFRIPNPQAFLGSPAADVVAQTGQPGMPPQAGAPAPGVVPGQPMGGPAGPPALAPPPQPAPAGGAPMGLPPASGAPIA
jgi:hypothetical protein